MLLLHYALDSLTKSKRQGVEHGTPNLGNGPAVSSDKVALLAGLAPALFPQTIPMHRDFSVQLQEPSKYKV